MSVMPAADDLRSPPATRLRRPGWRDPRLAGGLVLVAVATVTGARLLSSPDDSVPVWATVSAVHAGDDVSDVELVSRQVRLDDEASLTAYLSADQQPTGIFGRDLGSGELVPATALEVPDGAERSEIPLAVELGDAPVDLTAGDLVDVWVVPEPGATTAPVAPAERLLEAVSVTTVGSADSLGATSRQVVVRVEGADELGGLLSRLGRGAVVLVRVEG